ncbi:MAG: MotA/TolQ/ExbB proton channel family protein [Rhodothermaceae bacterium]|nr:MotA/TolQ/ExbB proton channel family protein [Rhodothermaceae bacterium]MYD66852.1 MotA/TolQ/ExbB proton channel family protein [Rhodothermaceae bacterium]MYI78152.1 MotA/TolQ/ExbB proton channel family protein [Gammaproteobacteria bacterium]
MFQDTTAVDTLLTSLSESGGGQNLLDIIGLAGGFQWPILFVFVLGLGALMNTLVRLFNDERESKELQSWEIQTMKTQEFRTAAKQGGQSIYHALLRRLLRRIEFTSDHGTLLKTVAVVIQDQRDRLAMTEKLVNYCSNACGAIGFTGTLVGIYSSFAAGGTDPKTIFIGISLALVSTLLGVVASLLLETADTFVSRYVGKRYAVSREWGEDLCARMSHLMKSRNQIRAKKSRNAQPSRKRTSSKTKAST